MIDLILKNWISLISLSIALIGGIPGLITVLNNKKAQPKLAAYVHHLSPFSCNDTQGKSLVGLILHISIGNKGKDALVPLVFQLECKISGKWVSFEASSIPEGFTITGPGWQHKYTNVAKNDIQKRQQSITRESPINGHLSFASRSVSFDELNRVHLQMPLRLKCVDLFGKTYKFILNNDMKPTNHENSNILPLKGVDVKTPSNLVL